MNNEPMIKITEPEVVSKIEPIENGATGVIIYNYDKCHIYYKGVDLGTFEELLNVKKYINDLQKQAEQGEHYKHLYSEVKKQKDNGVEYIRENVYIDYYGMSLFREKDGVDKLLRMLGEIDG